MGQLRYVVASLPRSGTKYISTVLSKIGLNCGHERSFGPKRCKLHLDTEDVFGDASWMVVPWIDELPRGTVVLHQLRDPIKVLNSNLPPGGDSYFRSWDEHAGLASDPLYKKPIPWKRFIWENTQNWTWPNGEANAPESDEEIARLIHWWINWNLWIEHATLRRSDLTYIWYRLEDLNAGMLKNIAALFHKEVQEAFCQEVIESTSPTLNRHRKPNDRITTSILPPQALLLMHRYGYDLGSISK